MKKLAYGLIGLAIVVGIALWFFYPDSPEPMPIPTIDRTTIRSTEGGDYVGFVDSHGARAWLGIAYAQPPVGELRWKAPLPPFHHDGLKDANIFGNACVQFASPIGPTNDTPDANNVVGDEDCLYLNIWSAPNTQSAPVMVWIHGGGNTIGHAGSYNGASLAARHKVVVVTVNYRLGLMGWFHHPKVAVGSPEDQSGNFGNLDIVRALEWVRDNIEVFGGDPTNVTLFGESAGARNTLGMIATPLAKGLFHRAIVQSGGYWTTDKDSAMAMAADGGHQNSSSEIINRVLDSDSADIETDVTKGLSIAQLRSKLESKRATDFYAAIGGDALSGMSDIPLIAADGYVVPNAPLEEIFGVAGAFNDVPVILGTNRDEPSLFMVMDPQHTETTLGIFRSLRDESEYLRRVYYGAQSWKVGGVDSIAQLMTGAGHTEVYAYRFDWDEEPDVMFFELSKALGAAHGLEIAFVFGDFGGGLGLDYIYPNNSNQFQLSDSMMSYWVEFAYTGDPGRGRSKQEVAWLGWGVQGQSMLVLDTATDGGIRMSDEIVTVDGLLDELRDDPAISPSVRCEIYQQMRRPGSHPRFSDETPEEFGCSQRGADVAVERAQL